MRHTPLLDELSAIERRLHDPATRRNSAEVAHLLADEFLEFGKSGHVYDKPATLQLLAEEARNPALIEATGFALIPVSSDAALLTYRSTSDAVTVLRSSLWIYRQGRWQMLFHQGTLAAAARIEAAQVEAPGMRR